MTPKLHHYCEKCDQCISVKEFPKHTCGKDFVCCVCMGEFALQEHQVVLPCSSQHRMHWPCWQKLNRFARCPLCRKMCKLIDLQLFQLAVVADWLLYLKNSELV